MSRTINRPEWSQYVHNGIGFGFGIAVSGVASTVNLTQLWNPVSSGVRMVIFKAELAAGATCQTQFALDPTQFVTSPTTQTPVNLLAGTAAKTQLPQLTASKAVLITAQPALGPVSALNVRRSLTAANSKDDCASLGIISELGEGMGFDVFNNTQNVLTITTLWWAEVPTATYAA